jgi:hypothetical protein
LDPAIYTLQPPPWWATVLGIILLLGGRSKKAW